MFLKRTDSAKGNTSGEGSELEFQFVEVEGGKLSLTFASEKGRNFTKAVKDY